MNKNLLAVLLTLFFCVGIANATSTASIFCPPGATVNSTGPNSTPPLTGTATCPAYTAPVGNVVTSVVLTIEGDMESPAGNGTFTYNFTFTNFAPVSTATEVITATGNVSGPFTWTAPGSCTTASDTATCTVSASGATFPAITVGASGTWTAGSAGLLPNGAETFNVTVVYNYSLIPVTANCAVITAVQGVPITPVTIAGSGGVGGPYTFSATGLPTGLTMSSGGTISGTPTVSGTFNYTVTVTDSAGNKGTVNCSVTVTPPGPPTATCASITAVVGVAITPITVTASGGAGPPYTFVATGLPPGLTMSSGGTISGTPTVSGTFNYTVTVTDSAGNTGTVNCSVDVLPTPPPPSTCFFVSYATNLTVGESYVNIINTGAAGAPLLGPGFGAPVGNICVNVYTFDPGEEEVSCCSCLLTPNQVANLGVNRDLISKTLTGVIPTSVTIKLVCTLAGGDGTGTNCNQNAAVQGFQTPSLAALGTTVQPAGTKYSVVEHLFVPSTLSASEYASITSRCASIVGNGSTYGICGSCQLGALGAAKQ